MSEYIEREALIEEIKERNRNTCNGSMSCLQMKRMVDKVPAADAVPVVHCRHCRSYNKPRLGWCSVHLDREGPDDFCGYGERKDNDEF